MPVGIDASLEGFAGAGAAVLCGCLQAPDELLLGNALICGVISGPHDRYGARMVWIATLVALIAAIRHFSDSDEPEVISLSP